MAKSKKDTKGWVKISRTILDNFLWTSEKPFDDRSAWIDLILLMNHEDGAFQTKRGEIVKVPRGSHFTSIRKLAERWHWSKSRVDRYIGTLIDAKMVTQSRTQSGTLLNLVNYSNYQGRKDTDRDTDRDTDDTRTRTKELKNKRNSMPLSPSEKMEAMRRHIEEMKKEGEE